jgi:hypothetical protein
VAVVEMVNVMMRVTDRQGPVSVIDRESACQRVAAFRVRRGSSGEHAHRRSVVA